MITKIADVAFITTLADGVTRREVRIGMAALVTWVALHDDPELRADAYVVKLLPHGRRELERWVEAFDLAGVNTNEIDVTLKVIDGALLATYALPPEVEHNVSLDRNAPVNSFVQSEPSVSVPAPSLTWFAPEVGES